MSSPAAKSMMTRHHLASLHWKDISKSSNKNLVTCYIYFRKAIQYLTVNSQQDSNGMVRSILMNIFAFVTFGVKSLVCWSAPWSIDIYQNIYHNILYLLLYLYLLYFVFINIYQDTLYLFIFCPNHSSLIGRVLTASWNFCSQTLILQYTVVIAV